MMSASAISAMIRAKKKKMEDDREAVKLSGIPEDAQDVMIAKNHEYGEMMSKNKPMDRDEEPSIESEMDEEKMAQPHDEMAADPMLDDEKMKRKSKIKSMLMKMGK